MGLGFKHRVSGGLGPSPAHRFQQINVESLGPFDLILKSISLIQDNAVLSAWIQLTIVLPAAIAMLLNHGFFYAIIHKFMPYPRPPSPPDELPETRPDIRMLIFIGIVLVVLGFVLTVNLVSAVFYVVSVVDQGESITFKDVLRALPGQWRRVAVTGFWGELFFAGMALVLILSQILIMMFFDVSRVPLLILIIVTFSVVRSFLFFIVTTLQMAYAVTVFEKLDGLAAYIRGWKLLKSRWWIALWIFVLLDLPKTMLGDALSAIVKSQQCLHMKRSDLYLQEWMAPTKPRWKSVHSSRSSAQTEQTTGFDSADTRESPEEKGENQ
ncbi:hypothetical protein AXG93_1467s1330 [Marchantia polymorpha subsp. ruderalis]|uniref:Transmembrane protein n=1 Tax=Marchantia polymorpha subsp. ruderalis TaxID=1480154 RepID=A0A176WLM5_MARPO|nr:hypothetical protein AXG93_1467s1330 [Marchantia polymorpha subsp. ruderalis]